MKIIQITAAYKPAFVYGGPTMSVSKLSEELLKGRANIEVICTTANGKDEIDVSLGKTQMVDGVGVRYFKRLTKDHSHFSPGLYQYLWKNTGKNTIVHIHAWWNLVSVISCIIALLKGSKTVISPRGTLSGYSFNNRTSFFKRSFHSIIGRFLLKRCHFHVTSEKEKQDILALLSPQSVHIIPNFVQLPLNYISSATSHPMSNGICQLLFLSRIEEKKGLELLFTSLSKIEKKWTLTIAGSGDAAYIQDLIKLGKDLNIDGQITWLGQVSNENKFNLITKHHLLVLPSYDENFANVVIESLAMGTPVLITENVGLADYVRENDLGWICQRTEAALVESLNAVFNNVDKLKEIGEVSPKVIYKDFNENNLRDKYLQFYHNIDIL